MTITPHLGAQLNKLDSTRLIIKLSSSGSLLEGNVSRFLLVNRMDMNYANTSWAFSNRTDYQYGQRNHELSENDIVIYNFFYYKPVKKVYSFLMTIVETNYRRKIQLRYQAGPGISWTAIKHPDHLFRVSLTATWEKTSYRRPAFENLSDTSSRKLTTLRIIPRLYGIHTLFKNRIHLIYECWWQQSTSSTRNYRFFLEQGLEIPLLKHIDLKTTLRYTYENVRIKNLKPYDLFWVFGITIKNY